MDLEKMAQIFEAVKVIPLRPTDLLVFRSARIVSCEEAARLRETLIAAISIPSVKVIICDGGNDIEVIRKEAA